MKNGRRTDIKRRISLETFELIQLKLQQELSEREDD